MYTKENEILAKYFLIKIFLFCKTLFKIAHTSNPKIDIVNFKRKFRVNHLFCFSETNVHSVELLLDTPNSNTNRKLSLTVEGSVQNPKRYLNVKVNSPWTNVDLNGNNIFLNISYLDKIYMLY